MIESMETSTARGEFIPQTNVLPEQYAHFNELEGFTKKLTRIADTSFYEQAYNASWIALCMQIDRKEQSSLMSGLKEVANQTNKDTHSEHIQSYWETLQATSIYPTFEKVRKQLEMDGYANSVVQSWTHDGEPFNFDNQNLKNSATAEGAKIYPYVWNKDLMDETFGDLKNMGAIRNTKVIFETLSSLGVSSELIEYVAGLKLLISARSLTRKILLGQIDMFDKANKGELGLHIPDMEAKITQVLKRVDPYHQVAISMATAIHEKEEELFGDDAHEASTLWGAAIFLRGDELPSGKLKQIRATIMEKLVHNDYIGAKMQIEEILTKYPNVLPRFVQERLDLDPELLREMMNDVDIQPKVRNKVKEANNQRRLAIEELKPYLNKELVSSDGKMRIRVNASPDNPDGTYSAIGISDNQTIRELLGRKSLGVIRPIDVLTIVNLFDLKPMEES